MSTSIDFPVAPARIRARGTNTIELITPPQTSEQTLAVESPLSDVTPPIRRNAGSILVLVWLTFLKFGALLLLVAVIVAPRFPGLVVLGLMGAILAPPYLVLRRLLGRT